MGTQKLTDIVREITPGKRAAIDGAKAELRAEHLAFRLKELRKQRGLTQVELASRIGKSQAAVSAMESAKDSKLSTLIAAVNAMDGYLEIVAVFDDERISLTSD